MDEADDFVPQGVQLEGELDVRSVASSHRTPVLRDHPEEVLPHEAVALYHSYAQEQLAQRCRRRASRFDGALRTRQSVRPAGRAPR